MNNLPAWLDETTVYQRPATANRFISTNVRALTHVLAHFNKTSHVAKPFASAWAELLSFLTLVLITITCRSLFLLWFLTLFQLLLALFMPAKVITETFFQTLRGALIGALIVWPSVLFNHNQMAWLWLAKLVLIIFSLQIFRHRVGWSQLVVALRQLGVSSIFILTLDITIKYSHVLSQDLHDRLQAVWLRSCGTIHHPIQIYTNLVGCLYLQCRKQATELYEAMLLRGYTEKPARRHFRIVPTDWLLLVQTGCFIGIAIFLAK
ncbi:hypothetical protein [Furfurilactobacillus entadae]|uniref:hypothetical protein n=1 Tax=Furfurilactobacillus entadae TaxID=2922307 RepID=UPI0035EDBC45